MFFISLYPLSDPNHNKMRVNHKRHEEKKEAREKGSKAWFFSWNKREWNSFKSKKEKGNKNINLMEALGWNLESLWVGFVWIFLELEFKLMFRSFGFLKLNWICWTFDELHSRGSCLNEKKIELSFFRILIYFFCSFYDSHTTYYVTKYYDVLFFLTSSLSAVKHVLNATQENPKVPSYTEACSECELFISVPLKMIKTRVWTTFVAYCKDLN